MWLAYCYFHMGEYRYTRSYAGKPSKFISSCSGGTPIIKITMSSKHAAIMPSASTTMPKDKHSKETKLPYKSVCFSIWPIRRTMKKLWCNTTKNCKKALKTNFRWLPSTTWEATTSKPHKFIKNCSWKPESSKQLTSTLLFATTKWSILMYLLKYWQAMRISILKAYLLPILRLATTINSIMERTQRTVWKMLGRSLKVVTWSKKVTCFVTI